MSAVIKCIIFFAEEWKTLLLKNYEWFLSNVNYKAVESKKSNDKKIIFNEKLSLKTLVLD